MTFSPTDAGLHGQLPQVGGELDGHPLQVLQGPEVQRPGPAAPPARPGPVFPAAPPGPLRPAGSSRPARRDVPVLLAGGEPRARLLADSLRFLAQPARVLAHPPGGVLPRRLGPAASRGLRLVGFALVRGLFPGVLAGLPGLPGLWLRSPARCLASCSRACRACFPGLRLAGLPGLLPGLVAGLPGPAPRPPRGPAWPARGRRRPASRPIRRDSRAAQVSSSRRLRTVCLTSSLTSRTMSLTDADSSSSSSSSSSLRLRSSSRPASVIR